MIPFKLEEPSPEKPPTSTKPVSLTTEYVKPASTAIDALRWALEHARVVDIDLQCDISQEDALWEDFVEVLTKATADLKATPIVLCTFYPRFMVAVY